MKTRYPARTALVTALALTFGASVFAADQVAQSSYGSSATDRSATSAQDGTRSTDPQVNPGQSGFNDWTQRNNTTAPGTSNAQDATTRSGSITGTDGVTSSDRGTTGAVGGSSYGSGGASSGQAGAADRQDGTRSTNPQVNPGQSGFNDWTQRNNTPGTRSNAQDTTTRGSNAQDRTSGAGAAGTMRDGTSRDAARQHRGMMDGSMSDAMRRQHDGMMRGDASAQQDMLNHVEPGASETRVHLYPESGNAQAD